MMDKSEVFDYDIDGHEEWHELMREGGLAIMGPFPFYIAQDYNFGDQWRWLPPWMGVAYVHR